MTIKFSKALGKCLVLTGTQWMGTISRWWGLFEEGDYSNQIFQTDSLCCWNLHFAHADFIWNLPCYFVPFLGVTLQACLGILHLLLQIFQAHMKSHLAQPLPPSHCSSSGAAHCTCTSHLLLHFVCMGLFTHLIYSHFLSSARWGF